MRQTDDPVAAATVPDIAEMLLTEYASLLQSRAVATRDAYLRVLRQLIKWLGERPDNNGQFQPIQLTRTALESYFAHLEAQGYSISHRARAKAAISSFANFLIEEKEVLRRNPTLGLLMPTQSLLTPRELSPDQRYILRNLVERDGQQRSAALFTLGYYAGCRVSDVAWLQVEHIHLTSKMGWLQIGHKGGKVREIDLVNEVRRALFEYDQQRSQTTNNNNPYFFSSQRSDRLSEAGIHHWFRRLKAKSSRNEWEQVKDITFHDLRHDFAHRTRASGWTIEEVAYYLGHITRRGIPAIATTARYTQVSRESLKAKLKLVKG